MNKFRALCFSLALILLNSSILSGPAFAAGKRTAAEKQTAADLSEEKQNKTSAENTGTVITEIEITDVSEPVEGHPLDTEATVRAYKDGIYIGISWKIPVMWIDESGKTAAVAESGKAYIPVFVFFVPDGYELKGIDFDRLINVKLPSFMSGLYLQKAIQTKDEYTTTNGIIAASDPASGITYISGRRVKPGSEGPYGRIIEWGNPDSNSGQINKGTDNDINNNTDNDTDKGTANDSFDNINNDDDD
ncbi:MAG: hypothetical protein IJ805_05525, partial [Lachnospiraceae bacterium]|nr:hypothetical protein [Lachnospiraceae bacterium]